MWAKFAHKGSIQTQHSGFASHVFKISVNYLLKVPLGNQFLTHFVILTHSKWEFYFSRAGRLGILIRNQSCVEGVLLFNSVHFWRKTINYKISYGLFKLACNLPPAFCASIFPTFERTNMTRNNARRDKSESGPDPIGPSPESLSPLRQCTPPTSACRYGGTRGGV